MSQVPIALFNRIDSVFTNLSTSATTDGTAMDIGEARSISTTLTWSSQTGFTGSLQLFCSCDGTNFVSVGTTTITGASGTVGINFDLPAFYYAKIRLTRTAGSIVITSASMSAKR
jgi:hypothetical protein